MLRLALGAAALALVLAVSVPDLAQRLVAVLKVEQAPAPADAAGPARVNLAADGRGHFEADLAVNGRSVRALVDTGASLVALTWEEGRALGLIRPGDRMDVRMQTANGTAGGKRVMLNSVRLGGIALSNVEGVVAEEGALPVNLLGMTFLNRLRSFEMSGGRLLLEQ